MKNQIDVGVGYRQLQSDNTLYEGDEWIAPELDGPDVKWRLTEHAGEKVGDYPSLIYRRAVAVAPVGSNNLWKIRIDDGYCAYDYDLRATAGDVCIHDLAEMVRERLRAPFTEGRLTRKFEERYHEVAATAAEKPRCQTVPTCDGDWMRTDEGKWIRISAIQSITVIDAQSESRFAVAYVGERMFDLTKEEYRVILNPGGGE